MEYAYMVRFTVARTSTSYYFGPFPTIDAAEGFADKVRTSPDMTVDGDIECIVLNHPTNPDFGAMVAFEGYVTL